MAYNSAAGRNWGTQYLDMPEVPRQTWAPWQQVHRPQAAGGNGGGGAAPGSPLAVYGQGMALAGQTPTAPDPNMEGMLSPFSAPRTNLSSTMGQANNLVSQLMGGWGQTPNVQAPNLQMPAANFGELPQFSPPESQWDPPVMRQPAIQAEFPEPPSYGAPRDGSILGEFAQRTAGPPEDPQVSMPTIGQPSVEGRDVPQPTLQQGDFGWDPSMFPDANLSQGDPRWGQLASPEIGSPQSHMPQAEPYSPEISARQLPSHTPGGPGMRSPSLSQAPSLEQIAGASMPYPVMDYGFDPAAMNLFGGVGGATSGGGATPGMRMQVDTGIDMPEPTGPEASPKVPQSGLPPAADRAFGKNWKAETDRRYKDYLSEWYELESRLQNNYRNLQTDAGLGYGKQAVDAANLLANYNTNRQGSALGFLGGLL